MRRGLAHGARRQAGVRRPFLPAHRRPLPPMARRGSRASSRATGIWRTSGRLRRRLARPLERKVSRRREPPLRRRALNLEGESRIWARERSLAEAHIAERISVKVVVHTITAAMLQSTDCCAEAGQNSPRPASASSYCPLPPLHSSKSEPGFPVHRRQSLHHNALSRAEAALALRSSIAFAPFAGGGGAIQIRTPPIIHDVETSQKSCATHRSLCAS